MYRGILVTLLIVAVPVLAQAPPSSNRAAIEKQIVANERAVNDAFAKGDAKAFHASLAPDSVAIDPTGVMKVDTPEFDKLLETVKVQNWNIDGSQFYWIDDHSAVQMYRWTGTGTFEGQPLQSPMWCSTVWANRGGKWLAVFHQETNAMPPPPPAAAKPAAAPKKK